MNDWEEKLNTLLADPDAMAQVMQLAKQLSGGETPAAAESESAADAAQNPAAALSQLLGGLDPALLKRLLPLLQQYNRKEDGETAALLLAMRPFLKERRREKVERAVQLSRLIHLARIFFTAGEE